MTASRKEGRLTQGRSVQKELLAGRLQSENASMLWRKVHGEEEVHDHAMARQQVDLVGGEHVEGGAQGRMTRRLERVDGGLPEGEHLQEEGGSVSNSLQRQAAVVRRRCVYWPHVWKEAVVLYTCDKPRAGELLDGAATAEGDPQGMPL